MPIHIIVDGYNLIRKYPPLARVEEADFAMGRDFLLQWLSEYRRGSHNTITVIFDGGKGGGISEERDIYKGIKILYSRMGQTADKVIKRIVAKEGEKALVVTSDLELSLSCRSLKSGTIRSEDFAQKIHLKRMKYTGKISEKEEDEDRHKNKKGISHRPSKKIKKEKKHWDLI